MDNSWSLRVLRLGLDALVKNNVYFPYITVFNSYPIYYLNINIYTRSMPK